MYSSFLPYGYLKLCIPEMTRAKPGNIHRCKSQWQLCSRCVFYQHILLFILLTAQLPVGSQCVYTRVCVKTESCSHWTCLDFYFLDLQQNSKEPRWLFPCWVLKSTWVFSSLCSSNSGGRMEGKETSMEKIFVFPDFIPYHCCFPSIPQSIKNNWKHYNF